MKIREADLSDVGEMVRLSEQYRATLPNYSPVLWRKSRNSADKQAAFFRALVPLEETLAFVVESGSSIAGFIVARLQAPPPVYDPGGPVCLVDDFCVSSDSEWERVGAALLGAVESRSKERGAVLSVVVCPQRAHSKRGFLARGGFQVASEWHVRAL